MMIAYNHRQMGWFLIAIYSAIMAALVILGLLTAFRVLMLLAFALLLTALALFSSLTVSVGPEALQIAFGLGIVRKRFRLDEIAAVRAVRNPWYYGLGIRYTPRGWLYAVSGTQAIELHMRNGRTYRIGTDDRERLMAAIEQARASLPGA